MKERLFRCTIAELRPGHDPRICGVPPHAARRFGCFGKPERFALQKLEPRSSIKDRRILAPFFAVSPADAAPRHIRQQSFKITKLRKERFLNADEICFMKANDT